jgi:invasion protein IalB
VFIKECKLIPHPFILREQEIKNCFPFKSLNKFKLDKSQVYKLKKESRLKPLRFPLKHYPTRR